MLDFSRFLVFPALFALVALPMHRPGIPIMECCFWLHFHAASCGFTQRELLYVLISWGRSVQAAGINMNHDIVSVLNFKLVGETVCLRVSGFLVRMSARSPLAIV
jgi:hypothetical protein